MLIGKKVFVFLTVVIVVLAAILFWFFQRNTYSKEVLKLEVLAPEEAKAGEEANYTLKYRNNGNVRLEDMELVFEFPSGSLPLSHDSRRVTKHLEDLYPGEEEILSFKAQLFGREGELEKGRASLTYRVKNLKPFYESKTTFSTKIKEVPINFTLDVPSKIVMDKETKLSLNYFSGLDSPVYDLGIRISYPSGFEFLRAKPEGIEKNEWQVGVLNKAEGGRIEIFGKLSDGVNEQRIFEAQLGVWLDDEFVLLKEVKRGVEIVEPRLIVSQRINGSTEYVASPGELLHYEISFKNVGEEFFEDLFLFSRLEGPLNFETLKSHNGKVNLNDQSILWDWRDIPELRFLGPGEEGRVEFWVNVKEDLGQERNPMIKNNLSLSQLKEEFRTKIKSSLVVSQKGYFNDEVFGNSGPIPPRVGERTTYTIVWEVANRNNSLKNVRLRAPLPQGVELTGKIYPEEEKSKLTFDSASREVLWSLGDLEPGVGDTVPSKILSFQISVVPSAGQRGLVLTLINQGVVEAEDDWTETTLSLTFPAVDSTLPDDPTINTEQGIVR